MSINRPESYSRMTPEEFRNLLAEVTGVKQNRFHPFVWITGEPEIGEGVYIGGFSEVNARGAKVRIGNYCDIASFVSINCADSHKRCIGLIEETERGDITIEDHVFVGSHSFIKGGAHIGHHSVVAAGTIVGAGTVPPYSLVVGNPMQIKAAYYRDRLLGSERN
jgi:acetyltransferase-like isoleucine patch superfamily enzyme